MVNSSRQSGREGSGGRIASGLKGVKRMTPSLVVFHRDQAKPMRRRDRTRGASVPGVQDRDHGLGRRPPQTHRDESSHKRANHLLNERIRSSLDAYQTSLPLDAQLKKRSDRAGIIFAGPAERREIVFSQELPGRLVHRVDVQIVGDSPRRPIEKWIRHVGDKDRVHIGPRDGAEARVPVGRRRVTAPDRNGWPAHCVERLLDAIRICIVGHVGAAHDLTESVDAGVGPPRPEGLNLPAD